MATTENRPDPQGGRTAAGARAFDSCAVPYLLGPWVPDLIAAAAIRPGSRILDAACGTGAVARQAAPRTGAKARVTAMDISLEMVQVGRQGAGGGVLRWCVGDALHLPFADASFDIVLCQQGLQFFPDRPRALAEFRRVLVRDGLAALAVWGRLALNPYPAAMARAAGRRLGEDVGRQLRTAFTLGDPADLRGLIRASGFRSVSIRSLSKTLVLPPLGEFVPRHFACTSVAAAFTSAPPEARAALVADVVEDLEVREPARDVSFHFEVNLALAR